MATLRMASKKTMEDPVRQLNIEYELNLTEEEIDQIAAQAEAAQRLLRKLYEVDVEGIVPALKIEPAAKT